MIGILAIYAALALIREVLVIRYYRAIFIPSAFSASLLSGAIEILDLFVISTIILRLSKGGNLIPAVVYVVFSSLGVYVGLKINGKRQKYKRT